MPRYCTGAGRDSTPLSLCGASGFWWHRQRRHRSRRECRSWRGPAARSATICTVTWEIRWVCLWMNSRGRSLLTRMAPPIMFTARATTTEEEEGFKDLVRRLDEMSMFAESHGRRCV